MIMDYKRIKNKVIVRLDPGEEIVESLKQICTKLDINLGIVTGIGATNDARIGLYDLNSREYHSQDMLGDHEIAQLSGNITTMDDEVYLHLHVNLCNAEHKSFGGHLNSAVVSATFEAVIEVIDGKVERKLNKKIGLNLLDI